MNLFEADMLVARLPPSAGTLPHGRRGAHSSSTTSSPPPAEPKQVSTDTIHTVCLAVLAAIAIILALWMLQGLFLPLLIAAGLAVLLEPVVFLLVDPLVRCVTPKRRRPGLRGVLDDNSGKIEVELLHQREGGFERSGSGKLSLGAIVCCRVARHALWEIFCWMWCTVAVLAVIVGLLLLVASLGAWMVSSVQSVNWSKYINSPRMKMVRNLLAEYGAGDFEGMVRDIVGLAVEALGVGIVDSAVVVLTGVLLVILFLGFFLLDSANDRRSSKEPWRLGQRKLMAQVMLRISEGSPALTMQADTKDLASTLLGRLRIQMRVYIKGKFYLSVLKAVVIGGVFAALKVDMWVLWTVLTFILNFMPLGSSISTFAPIPFVFMDPDQSLAAVIICVAWPLLVHNVVGNVVEPRLFACSLNLHPVTVLFALAFWTAIWGVLGALVCVPLTACLRVTVLAVRSHPFAKPLLWVLEGRLS